MRVNTAAALISELADTVLAALDNTAAMAGADVPDALVARIRERTRSFA
jgi:hypothetical protein